MADTTIDAATEMLVTRRSRRSTAGNRMEAVMAEMALEDSLKDLDDDVEFQNENDEQDVFGSDFESTDEEAEKQVEEAGEAEVAHEEKRVKKVAARTRLEKVTAAAHAKHKSTFNPDIQLSTPTVKAKLRPRANRVQLGAVLDAETGEVVGSTSQGPLSKKRMSKRKHTVLNSSATVTRLKESQKKKATQPRKSRAETKTYSQSELIALALDTEEGNIVEHRDYLKNEAEKRKRARVVRTAVEGPKLRWLSRREDVKVPVAPPPLPPAPAASATPQPLTSVAYRSVYGPPGTLFTPTTYTYSSGAVQKTTLAASSSSILSGPQSTTSSPLAFAQYSPYHNSAFPTWPPTPVQQQSYYPSSLSTTIPSAAPTFIKQTPSGQQAGETTSATTSTLSTTTVSAPQLAARPPMQQFGIPEQQYRTETVTKNYVVHEVSQLKGGPKPTWSETMQAMFGDHVKWDEVKVLVGKGRPLSRPRQTCPITGRQAHYLDPRTGVPYADSYAYKTLSQLLKHEYVWNPSLGSYMDRGEPPLDAPDGDGYEYGRTDRMDVN